MNTETFRSPAQPIDDSESVVLSFEQSLPHAITLREQSLLARVSAILGENSYVWVDLPTEKDASPTTVYFKRLESGYSVHVGSPRERSEVRWTAIEGRFFVGASDGASFAQFEGGTSENFTMLLSQVEAVMDRGKGKPHFAMVFTTGMHHVRVAPWIPNSGGIEAFLREIMPEVAALGFRVSIATRGGMPHPKTGEPLPDREVLANGVEIFYLRDGHPTLIRKESLDQEHYGPLVAGLTKRLRDEGVSVVCSHYFDGLKIGDGVVSELRSQGLSVPHVHVLHSLGALKREVVSDREAEDDRMAYRLDLERELLPRADAIVTTSKYLAGGLASYHGLQVSAYMPPCINPSHWYRRQLTEADPIWEIISHACALRPSEVLDCKIVVEMGRTVARKRKDDLIRAFELLHREDPQTLLAVSVDARFDAATARMLNDLIDSLDADTRRHIAVLKASMEPDMLARLFSAASLHVTPAIAEGWGMLVQEAAACGCPSLTSSEVAYNTEVLMGEARLELPKDLAMRGVEVGMGGAICSPRDVEGLAAAMKYMLGNPVLLRRIGEEAMRRTVNSFNWKDRTAALVGDLRSALGSVWTDAPPVAGSH
jgi:glycosyltransferase involved in cell wall biosynthesis